MAKVKVSRRMRQFTINGVEVLAKSKSKALKKYDRMNNGK